MNAIKLFDYNKFVVKQLEENEDSLKKKKKSHKQKRKNVEKKKGNVNQEEIEIEFFDEILKEKRKKVKVRYSRNLRE